MPKTNWIHQNISDCSNEAQKTTIKFSRKDVMYQINVYIIVYKLKKKISLKILEGTGCST